MAGRRVEAADRRDDYDQINEIFAEEMDQLREEFGAFLADTCGGGLLDRFATWPRSCWSGPPGAWRAVERAGAAAREPTFMAGRAR